MEELEVTTGAEHASDAAAPEPEQSVTPSADREETVVNSQTPEPSRDREEAVADSETPEPVRDHEEAVVESETPEPNGDREGVPNGPLRATEGHEDASGRTNGINGLDRVFNGAVMDSEMPEPLGDHEGAAADPETPEPSRDREEAVVESETPEPNGDREGAVIDSEMPEPLRDHEGADADPEISEPSRDREEAVIDNAALKAVIEAVIYITDEPLEARQISAALNQPVERVKVLLDELVSDYARPERGLTVRELAGGYKMSTKPEHHEAVRAFVKNLKPPLKLSLAALETLAVIAYKQPITAPEIMEIRGVQGAGVLKTLVDRKLIATAGKNVVGKPILYKTTKEFLIQFGLKDVSELPTLKEFEELGRLALSEGEPEPEPQSPSEPETSLETAELPDKAGDGE